jgi:aspartyl-tRNA synthetase
MLYSHQIGQLTPAMEDASVTLTGFVEVLRDQKRMQFVALRDRTGAIQLVNDKQGHPEIGAVVSSLTVGSTIQAKGTVVINESSKLCGLDLTITEVTVLSLADSPLPIDENSSEELQLDWRSLSLRTPRNRLMLQVQTTLEEAMRQFWAKERFLELHSPKLMGTASESGGELFSLDYFGGKAYLAQSPQFYKQMAMSAGLEKVFEIGPVFRANPSYTSRHDTEFTSVDMEVSWVSSHEDVMEIEERWLASVIGAVADHLGEQIAQQFEVEVVTPALPFPRITLKEAQGIVRAQGYTPYKEDDLDPESERRLYQWVQEEFGHEFLFVTDWPVSARPFYHMRHEQAPELTKSFDLIWKGLEITTGAQREHRYEVLTKQAEEKGFDLGPLKSYLDSFRFGCPPHGGCGVGLTRILMIMLGVKSVREVTFLYRGPNRLTP